LFLVLLPGLNSIPIIVPLVRIAAQLQVELQQLREKRLELK
jgi:hypothetical protein